MGEDESLDKRDWLRLSLLVMVDLPSGAGPWGPSGLRGTPRDLSESKVLDKRRSPVVLVLVPTVSVVTLRLLGTSQTPTQTGRLTTCLTTLFSPLPGVEESCRQSFRLKLKRK